jgi:asparagine synthase (glutamine-hydrolysing)
MCGIAGLLPRRETDPRELDRVVRLMTAALTHRGPDDEGYFVSPHVALGMRRLAVIDVAGGMQPMHSADGRLQLVFNGEIYNHASLRDELQRQGCHFRTKSDTEVLLRLLERDGTKGIERIEGMFGFAAWDAATRELTLARDWFGQKCIYYTETPLGLAFASEIKALLRVPGVQPQLDLTGLYHYMSMRYLPARLTFFAGIHKIPPAHAARVVGGEIKLERLWRPTYEPKSTSSEDEILDQLDATLRHVVEEHLVSDVPLGCFLSGGIDSSLIVAYAATTLKEPVRTFSIGVGEHTQDELPWARMVARQYQTRHFEMVVEPDLALLTPKMVAATEEPVDPFGAGVYVVSEIARKHVTVALGGDGGDELFAGYDRYLGQQFAERYALLPKSLRHRVLRPLLRRFPDSFQYNTLASRLRWIDTVSDYSGARRYGEAVAFLRFSHERKAALFTEACLGQVGSLVSEQLLQEFFSDGCASNFVDRMMHADLMTRIADNDLLTTDRLSMAHRLELRSPFLDRRVADIAMKIPQEMRLRKWRLKYMTRRLAERYLPRKLIYRPKKGFGFPLALWFRGPLQKVMQRAIDSSRLVEAGYFRRSAMQDLLDEHCAGVQDHNYRLWLLLNIEVFWRHFIDGDSTSDLEDWIDSSRRTSPTSQVTRTPEFAV